MGPRRGARIALRFTGLTGMAAESDSNATKTETRSSAPPSEVPEASGVIGGKEESEYPSAVSTTKEEPINGSEKREGDLPESPGQADVDGDDEKIEPIPGSYIPAEDEPEESCPFCQFMKAGPCGIVFADWEKCVDQAKEEEKDFISECHEKTKSLQQCLEGNMEYYAEIMVRHMDRLLCYLCLFAMRSC
ncbi:hypothetical protein CYMTET_25770 [Cymbomonas tetramitiformis]|uniref:GCK domain-containing protein n=1 Tax=Cymbomonas tetramitiformis TaxID=36881 RepID=A0AAE0FT34_9CHLO|nr:hypothetical protein CYMTET_25770 [Cymbomonas tetramitiformis]